MLERLTAVRCGVEDLTDPAKEVAARRALEERIAIEAHYKLRTTPKSFAIRTAADRRRHDAYWSNRAQLVRDSYLWITHGGELWTWRLDDRLSEIWPGGTPTEVAEALESLQRVTPYAWGTTPDGRRVWQYRGEFYTEGEGLTEAEVMAIVDAGLVGRESGLARVRAVARDLRRRLHLRAELRSG